MCNSMSPCSDIGEFTQQEEKGKLANLDFIINRIVVSGMGFL